MEQKSQIDLLYEAIGRRIRSEREKCGYTQTSFADRLHISRASLVNIEQGRQRATLHTMYEVARLLDISVTELLPDLSDLTVMEVKQEHISRIEQVSAGDARIVEGLTGFIKSSSTVSKTLV